MQKLYIKHGNRFKSFQDLLNAGYTYDATLFMFCTFYDKTCKNMQCHYARRSVADLLAIAKTYFPKIKTSEVVKTIAKHDLTMFFCWDVEQYVFSSNKGTGFTQITSRWCEYPKETNGVGHDGWSLYRFNRLLNESKRNKKNRHHKLKIKKWN